MKKLIAMCVLVTPLLATGAMAQPAPQTTPAAPAMPAAPGPGDKAIPASATKAPTAQQQKMKDCNEQAGDKKGDDRKAFMKQCLSAKGVQPTKTQQEKMSACSKEGKGKKGDDYKTFMKECLSK
ncbi:PsiF family protein [Cupriavidus pinatubonensis]|uniref:PsiF n=1 Tax=Cupriavidus pinatubonensis TaxID=248026 RepID=A0ABN7XR28_9BURK|nr:PsiF family protein [Cupriavidus pinatubonensis]CAG9163449.1 hypothetical protein LMG23994_00105 [Cupriavidus pinatubonensis]